MPGNILSADTGFPDLEKEGSTEEKLKTISSYLFMLLESLRYTLSNLGVGNFNEAELKLMSQTLTEPLTIRIESAEGDISQLYAAADEITTQVSALDGRVSQVKQTADGLVVTVAGNSGDIARISNTISGLNIQTSSTTGDGQTHISGVAMEIKDTRGNVLGYFRRDDNGSGDGETSTRMFLGATGAYALKLESKVSTSYESKQGSVYLKAGDSIILTPGSGGSVRVVAPNGTRYDFRNDGIYFNNVKIAPTGA